MRDLEHANEPTRDVTDRLSPGAVSFCILLCPVPLANAETWGMLPDKTAAITSTPPGEPELPPLVYDPDWARPGETPAGGFRDGHWIGFLFLMPFIVMFVVHELLGMADAFLMGGDTPWDDVSRGYNVAMFAALFLGSWAFLIHAVFLPVRQRRGGRWILPKLVFLVIYWLVVLLVMSWMSLLHP